MNTDLLKAVADRIELEDRFDLSHYLSWRDMQGARWSTTFADLLDDCNTVGCAAGWVMAVTGTEDSGGTTISRQAGRVLGLIGNEHDRLFYAGPDSIWDELADDFGWVRDREGGGLLRWADITAAQAAKVLRMIADGEVRL